MGGQTPGETRERLPAGQAGPGPAGRFPHASDPALAHSVDELKRYAQALQGRSDEALIGGVLP